MKIHQITSYLIVQNTLSPQSVFSLSSVLTSDIRHIVNLILLQHHTWISFAETSGIQLVLYILATMSTQKCLKLTIFSPHSKCYLTNHCTKTRLVCTHLNVFIMLNPNMTIKIWFSKFFQIIWKNWALVCSWCSHCVGKGMPVCNSI